MSLGIPARAFAAAAALQENADVREQLEDAAAAATRLQAAPIARRTTQRTQGELAAREKEIQREIVKLIEKRGGKVWETSQPRAAKVTPGLPDLIAFDPFRGHVYIEVKAPGGHARIDQLTFQALCQQHGIAHVLGGVAEVRAFLRGEGESK